MLSGTAAGVPPSRKRASILPVVLPEGIICTGTFRVALCEVVGVELLYTGILHVPSRTLHLDEVERVLANFM